MRERIEKIHLQTCTKLKLKTCGSSNEPED